jgi:hypothetical protein
MDIDERIEKFKRWELDNLARQLKVFKYYKFKKQELIGHIKANYSEQEIKVILDVKLPLWKKIKDYTHIYGIVTALARVSYL